MRNKIVDLQKLKQIVESEFSAIVTDVQTPFINELLIKINDDSFLDIWFSINLENRYSYHWERKHIDGTIYRHDNAPHLRWKELETFPKHFHNASEENVEVSNISDIPEIAIRDMMNFVKSNIKQA